MIAAEQSTRHAGASVEARYRSGRVDTRPGRRGARSRPRRVLAVDDTRMRVAVLVDRLDGDRDREEVGPCL